MHRAFRTTLHTSLAACAALAASATLASSEGVAIGNKNIPSIMKENEDNGKIIVRDQQNGIRTGIACIRARKLHRRHRRESFI